MTSTLNTSPEISPSFIVGIAVLGVGVAILALILALGFFRRPHDATFELESAESSTEKSFEKERPSTDSHASRSPTSFARLVLQRNFTPSFVLPLPLRPARARTNSASPTANSVSTAGILAHHEATGTVPRAFSRIPSFQFPKEGEPGHSHSPSDISFASKSTNTATAAILKVQQIFTPLLPDELVLRLGEQVMLIESYDDGWSIISRRAPWTASKSMAPFSVKQYAFGHALRDSRPEDVELGAVPSWVFNKDASVPQKRPIRNSSLGVTLVLHDNQPREEVISWSNL